MSRGLKLALFGAIAILFLGVAGLGYYVVMRPVQAAPAPAAAAKEEDTSTLGYLKLSHFVTDLADKDRARYVDVTIAVGVKDEATVETVKKQESQIRDIILTQLRACVAADLMGAAGKEKLATALKEPLSKLLKDNFKTVFITDMVVQ
jgi:flagellar basal body-associated protein FliL